MKELKIGTKVRHKKFEFEGVILQAHNGISLVEITEGNHPFRNGKDTFIAFNDNLDILDESKEVVASEEHEDTYAVEIETIDGQFIRFANYEDFIKTFLSNNN